MGLRGSPAASNTHHFLACADWIPNILKGVGAERRFPDRALTDLRAIFVQWLTGEIPDRLHFSVKKILIVLGCPRNSLRPEGALTFFHTR
jgi:hypothetical protein